jgi:hypothetical protein
MAALMRKRGYRNVKAVDGGGKAMEKYFEHYHSTYYGGKIINPITGKVVELKR